MADPFMLDSVAGVPAYTATEARLGIVVPPFFGGVSNPIQPRGGVLAKGAGNEYLVQAQVSPNMTVRIQPGQVIVPSSSSAGGAYSVTRETVHNLTIPTADGTFARRDRIVQRVRDQGSDHDEVPFVIAGTPSGSPALPSIPADGNHYFDLAEILVGAGVTSITSGNITDKRVFTVAHGGILPCLSSALPTFPHTGMTIVETDTGIKRMWNGSAWQQLTKSGGSAPLGEVATAVSSGTNLALTGSYQLVVSATFTNPSTARKYLVTYKDRVTGTGSGVARFKATVTAGGSPTEAGTQIGRDGQSPFGGSSNANSPILPYLVERGTSLPAGTVTVGIYALLSAGTSAGVRTQGDLTIVDIGA
jgi:hypothetical protein